MQTHLLIYHQTPAAVWLQIYPMTSVATPPSSASGCILSPVPICPLTCSSYLKAGAAPPPGPSELVMLLRRIQVPPERGAVRNLSLFTRTPGQHPCSSELFPCWQVDVRSHEGNTELLLLQANAAWLPWRWLESPSCPSIPPPLNRSLRRRSSTPTWGGRCLPYLPQQGRTYRCVRTCPSTCTDGSLYQRSEAVAATPPEVGCCTPAEYRRP